MCRRLGGGTAEKIQCSMMIQPLAPGLVYSITTRTRPGRGGAARRTRSRR